MTMTAKEFSKECKKLELEEGKIHVKNSIYEYYISIRDHIYDKGIVFMKLGGSTHQYRFDLNEVSRDDIPLLIKQARAVLCDKLYD